RRSGRDGIRWRRFRLRDAANRYGGHVRRFGGGFHGTTYCTHVKAKSLRPSNSLGHNRIARGKTRSEQLATIFASFRQVKYFKQQTKTKPVSRRGQRAAKTGIVTITMKYETGPIHGA